MSALVVLAGCTGGGGGDGTGGTTAADGGDGTGGTTVDDGTDGTTADDGGSGGTRTEAGAQTTAESTPTDGPDPTATTTEAATPEPTATMTETATATPRTTVPETTTPGETTTTRQAPQMPTYEFSEGETYTYAVNLSSTDSTSTATWTVTSVDGDRVSVEITREGQGQTDTSTVSATHSTVVGKSESTGSFGLFGLLRDPIAITLLGDFSPGNTYTFRPSEFPGADDVEWSSATVEVGQRTTVAGLRCTQFEMTFDGLDQSFSGCIADGYPFAASVTLTRQGRTLLTVRLQEYDRP